MTASRALRIGVVTTSYPRFAGDPTGHFVAAHVAALRALGHDVDVIAAGGRDDAGEPGIVRIPSKLFERGRGGGPEALERGGFALDAASFTARLAAAIAGRARRWDRAIAHWLAPSALAALAAVPARVPLVAIAHGGDVHTLARLRLLGATLALLRARRARVAFVSDELRAVAAAHGRVTGSIVQPMGIDVARFAALGRARESPPIILVLARLVPVKGVDVALAAMARLRAPARLVVAGDGPERAALEQLAARDGLAADRVAFAGAVDTRVRDELLGRASVVAVPSRVLSSGRTEGMPLAALEALAAGVPVVASAVGGLRGLGAATLVPPEDPDALARAIEQALMQPAPALQLRASVAHLAWPAIAARLLV